MTMTLGPLGQILALAERAADERRNLEHRDDARREACGVDALRLRTATGIGYVDRAALVDADTLERPRELLVREVGPRRLIPLAEPDHLHVVVRDDQPIGVAVRERAQQHAIHEGEDRDRGANADDEGHRGGDGEGRAATQRSPGRSDDGREDMVLGRGYPLVYGSPLGRVSGKRHVAGAFVNR